MLDLERIRRALLVVALAISVGGSIAAALGPALQGGDRLWPTVWLLWGAVGYLILLKRPGNGVGRAALAVGLSWGVSFGMLALSAAFPNVSLAIWAELINIVFGVFPWLAIIWLLLMFPGGILAGPGERVVARVLFVTGAVVIAGFAVHPVPMESTGRPSPLAIPALREVTDIITHDNTFFVVVGLVLVTLILLILRWRRSQGVERLQYRWLAVGTVTFLLSISLVNLGGGNSPIEYVWFLGGMAIPLSIGVAILRYRLFEIDRLISRSVTYVIVVGVLAAVFTVIVTLAGTILQTDNDLGIAASTLAVAGLFNPLRRQVRTWVDRRFDRSRYDAERVLASFIGSLQDEVDPDRLMSRWLAVVRDTLQPTSTGVWVKPAD